MMVKDRELIGEMPVASVDKNALTAEMKKPLPYAVGAVVFERPLMHQPEQSAEYGDDQSRQSSQRPGRQPQGGATYQPRATPWVKDMPINPKGIVHRSRLHTVGATPRILL